MYLQLTLPILITNILTVSYAIWDIHKQYIHTLLKPRLIMIAAMILSDLPASILTVLASVINTGWLEKKCGCYLYMAINYCWTFKVFALSFLTILVSAIILRRYNTKKLNKIGKCLNFSMFLLFLLVQVVFLPLSQAIASNKLTLVGKTYNRYCGAKSEWIEKGFYYWQLSVSLFTIIVSILLIIYTYKKNKYKETRSFRTPVTLILFAVINALSMFKFIVNSVLKVELPTPTKYVFLDIDKIVPTLFAVVYLVSENVYKRKLNSFSVNKVVNNYETRKLFLKYLLRVEEIKQHNLLERWILIDKSNNTSFEVFKHENLKKKEAKEFIEKCLEICIFGFVCSKEFCEYYEVYCKKGNIDVELEDELNGSN